MLTQLVKHLSQKRTVLREEWARRITGAELLTAMTPEELFSEATAGYDNVPQFGTHLRTNVGMDLEPEYIAIEKDGTRAFVTLQEANGIAILDLSSNAFTEIIG